MSTVLGRRERKKVESRERIISCAAALFSSRGYDATTMDDVGECADVSRATVFNYFPRKEDLVLAWFDNRRTQFAAELAERNAEPDNTTPRLRHAFQTLARVFENDPNTGRGMMRAWLHAGGPLLTPRSETEELFAGIIRAGKTAGDIAPHTDPDRTGRLLFDAYSGVLNRWVATEGAAGSLENELVTTLELILNGVTRPFDSPAGP